jgi:hypothetical protein
MDKNKVTIEIERSDLEYLRNVVADKVLAVRSDRFIAQADKPALLARCDRIATALRRPVRKTAAV